MGNNEYFEPWGYLTEARRFSAYIGSLKELRSYFRGIEDSYKVRKFCGIEIEVNWETPQKRLNIPSRPSNIELVLACAFSNKENYYGDDIADELNLDFVHVIKLINKLRKMGLIEFAKEDEK